MNMELIFLADRPEAIPTIARWYFDRWGYRDVDESVENICAQMISFTFDFLRLYCNISKVMQATMRAIRIVSASIDQFICNSAITCLGAA